MCKTVIFPFVSGFHKLFTEKVSLLLDNAETGWYLVFSTQGDRVLTLASTQCQGTRNPSGGETGGAVRTKKTDFKNCHQ